MSDRSRFCNPKLWTQRGINDARAKVMQHRKNSPETWIYPENQQAYKKAFEEESMNMLLRGETRGQPRKR